MSKLIPLTQNYHTLVSDDDFDWLSQYKWALSNGYAYNSKLGFMHKAIMPTSESYKIAVVDHINHIKNDNRRSNLRIITRSANVRNKPTISHIGEWWSYARQMNREGWVRPGPRLVWSDEAKQEAESYDRELDARQRIANTDMLIQIMLSDAEQRQFNGYSL